ncbi:MAG: hypothetical protein AAFR44_08975, partial [Pseudomonadota bacterium]
PGVEKALPFIIPGVVLVAWDDEWQRLLHTGGHAATAGAAPAEAAALAAEHHTQLFAPLPQQVVEIRTLAAAAAATAARAAAPAAGSLTAAIAPGAAATAVVPRPTAPGATATRAVVDWHAY